MADLLSPAAFLGSAVLLALILRRRQGGGRDVEQEEALWSFPFDDEPRGELSLLDALPRGFTEPTAVLVDDLAGLARLREALRDATVLALDVEAHGGTRVCCVQLSVGREAFVVDTLRPDVAALLPQALGPALASPTCTKLVHSGRNDVGWLHSLGMTIAPPLFDTAVAAAAAGLPTNLGGLALSLLAGEGSAAFQLYVAQFAETKSEYQRADWSVRPLAPDMLAYAAADAALLLPVARGMVSRLTPAALDGALEASSLVLGSVLMRPHPADGRVQAPSPRATRQERIAQGIAAAAARAKVKERRGAALFIPRTSPLYSNIELLHPNGTVMARVDRKKASWYLSNKAVDVFTGPNRRVHLDVAGMFDDASMEALAALEQPVALRLRKPPRGMGHAGDVFHLAERANICVVCGRGWQQDGSSEERNGLVRCYLLPRTHRHHLPLAAKSYTSHDVVLTCTNCHVRADNVSSTLARTLCQELGVATGSGALSRLSAQWADPSRWRTQGSEAVEPTSEAAGEGGPGWTPPKESAAAALGNCRRVAHTLSSAWTSMPQKRRRELASELAEWLASESLGGASGAAAVVPAIVTVLSRRGGEEGGEEEKEAATAAVPERRRTPARKPLRVRPTAASSAFLAEWPAFATSCPEGAAGLPSCDAMLVLAGIPHTSRIAPLVLETMAEAAGVTGVAGGGNVPLPLWADPAAHVLRHIILGTPTWHDVVEKGVYEHVVEPVIVPEPEAPGSETGLSGFPFDSEARLTLFIRRWRAHVYAELAPTALPVGWRVDYKVFAQGHRTWDKAEPELVQLLARELGLPDRPPPTPLD